MLFMSVVAALFVCFGLRFNSPCDFVLVCNCLSPRVFSSFISVLNNFVLSVVSFDAVNVCPYLIFCLSWFVLYFSWWFCVALYIACSLVLFLHLFVFCLIVFECNKFWSKLCTLLLLLVIVYAYFSFVLINFLSYMSWPLLLFFPLFFRVISSDALIMRVSTWSSLFTRLFPLYMTVT